MPPLERRGATSRLAAYASALPQYVLPHHFLSRLMYAATRVRFEPWKNWQIRWFVRRYRVDVSETVHADPEAYPDFNSFFTRALRAEARPLHPDPGAVVSPADGAVGQLGDIRDDCLVQAKGRYYSLARLLGNERVERTAFDGGKFITIYLAPHNYHRVHMPLRGTLCEMVHVPGRLFSVSAASTRLVSNLFARNERVASLFDTDRGPMAVVMVGALFVGSIEHPWSGVVTPAGGRGVGRWRYERPAARQIALERGQEMGRFNMGSTVVALFSDPRMRWRPGLSEGSQVKVGEQIAGSE